LTNFDFLFGEKRFASFSGAAAAAEKIFGIDTAACAVNARRAAELAVKWMYENDRDLPEIYRDQLAALTGASEFRALVGNGIVRALDYIRRAGNNAAHNPDSVTKDQAELALANLYDFALFLAKKYSTVRPAGDYDKSLLDPEAELVTEAVSQEDIRRLIAENRAMKRLLGMKNKPDEDGAAKPAAPLSEADTRRLYIETALAHAGWRQGVDCFTEYPVQGISGGSGVGYADYVLCDKKGVPLALIETQAAGRDIAAGRQQAKLYADALQRRFGRRPAIFLSDGFDTRVWFDDDAPERRTGGFYSRSDLLRERSLRAARRLPTEADYAALPRLRPYQTDAVRAAAAAFCGRGERSLYLAMAPGTGKTRTALAAAGLLRRCGRVRNLLFLCENELLADQAHGEFRTAFPDWSAARLSDRRTAREADVLFTTFAELAAEADELTDKNGAHLLSTGRFDLLICDEADRVPLQRYHDVFTAFDAPILALSSAPSSKIDPALCDLLHLSSDTAVYAYRYEDAVRDGWIAAFEADEAQTALLAEGISRESLSPAERRAYDKLFADRGEEPPAEIDAEELFTEYYNADTVRVVLRYLHEHGRTRDGRLGKTIIFTKNHEHSEMIYEEWARLFPADPPHFCRVIDSTVNYVHSLVNDFATSSLPQIAVSHDLLLDGVNVPAVENLVFFTRASSRNMFWRMLGRGMRRCSDLPDGKPSFWVLDLCGNFRAFGGENPLSPDEPMPVYCRNFAAQAALAYELQSLSHSESGAKLRTTLVKALHRRIGELDRESFSVRRRLYDIDRFSSLSAFDALSPQELTVLTERVAPLILPDGTSESASVFDGQMYTVMLARLRRREDAAALREILHTVRALSRMGTHRKIAQQKKLINRILYNGYLKSAPVPELETARRAISPLIRYLSGTDAPIRTAFTDRIISADQRANTEL